MIFSQSLPQNYLSGSYHCMETSLWSQYQPLQPIHKLKQKSEGISVSYNMWQNITFLRKLTSNLVDILQWQSQRFVRRTLRWVNVVESIHDCHTIVLLLVFRHLPTLEPWHLWTALQHVVSVPAGDRHKRNSFWVIADLLDVCRHLLLNLIVARLPSQSTRSHHSCFNAFLLGKCQPWRIIQLSLKHGYILIKCNCYFIFKQLRNKYCN